MSSKSMEFVSFPGETLRFLADLRDNNSREWFDSHRSEYEALCLSPGKAFVVAAGEVLREFVPGIRAEPRVLGSIFRITRDTRYGGKGGPYKDHLDFYFWEGERKKAVSSFFLRISPDFVGIGAGCHQFNPEELASFRDAVSDGKAASQLTAIVGDLEAAGYQVQGQHYKRVPKGWDSDGSGLRFLLHKALFVHTSGPATMAAEPGVLLREAARHWRALSSLHHWITHWLQR